MEVRVSHDADDRGAHCARCGRVMQPTAGMLAPWLCALCVRHERPADRLRRVLRKTLGEPVAPPPALARMSARDFAPDPATVWATI